MDRANCLRSLKESPAFDQFFQDFFLGVELEEIKEDLLNSIATRDKQAEEGLRERLLLRRRFEAYLETVEDEGVQAVQYLEEYKLAKQREEELNDRPS